jgi:cytoskeletal protein CcmA (bactofilin family)
MFKHKNSLIWPLMILAALLLVAAVALPFARPAQAAEIITGNPDAVVPVDVVIEDDLFIAGQTVRIDGTVRGDVFATATQIIINGTIEGNLFQFAQSNVLNGYVDGSVYGASYATTLGPESQVTGSLYNASFSFEAAEGSRVAHSLYTTGYQAQLAGEVARDALFSGAAFQLSGDVGRDLLVQIGEPSNNQGGQPQFYMPFTPASVPVVDPGYELTDTANVAGEIDYSVYRYDTSNPDVDPGAIASFSVANAVRTRIGEFFSLLIVGAVLLAVWPNQFERVELQLRQRPWQSLGWGFLAALVFPLALLTAVALLVFLAILGGLITLGELVGTIASLGGLVIAAAVALFSFAMWVGSKAVFGHFAGKTLLERASPATLAGRWGAFIALAIGVLIYEVVRFIPILGWLLALGVILFGLGAILVVFWPKRAEPAPAAAPPKTRKPKAAS